MTAWIDYLIASDDAADKALCEEFCALSWEHAQTTQWMVTSTANVTEDTLSRISDLHQRSDELQKRIHARALALRDAGGEPAQGEKLDAWVIRWRTLAQTHPDHDALPLPRA